MKELITVLLFLGTTAFASGSAPLTESDIRAIEAAAHAAFVGSDCDQVAEVRSTIVEAPTPAEPAFVVKNTVRCEGQWAWNEDETCLVTRQSNGSWAADYCDH